MSYKILTKNGIDNSNIDGARGEYFNSGMRDGIVQGVLNEGTFIASSSNVISFDTCELRIAGHRIVIDEPVYHTFTNAPSTDTRYAFVAQIIVGSDQSVEFSLFVQAASTPLIQNDLYKTISGAGTYQVEIGRFTLTTSLIVEDVVRTIDIITGGTNVNSGDYIKIGQVTTTTTASGTYANVDIENVERQGEMETDFHFDIPAPVGTSVVIGDEEQQSVSFTSDPQTQINNEITARQNADTTLQNNIDNETSARQNADTNLQTQIDARVKTSDLLNLVYPINSIYLSVNNTSPASLFGGSWEALAEGYALWTTTTSGEGGKTISAGLPNITGTTPMLNSLWNYVDATAFNEEFSGAIYSYIAISSGPGPTGSNKCQTRFGFDASKSNSIYGNSAIVQPPAIKIFAWKRIA